MSTVPPPPPGGYPPYDPKTQWRIYREQQKAAWRAQRDQIRAQAQAWKMNYRGYYGPRVPSVVGPLILVAVGVIWLMIYTGRIASAQFWTWYSHWWPMLLILAGLALLGEWALDARRATPVRRSSGFVGILIFLAVLGLCSSGWNNMGRVFGPWNWNSNGNDFFNSFGLPEHESDEQPVEQTIPANASIDIENPRGDVSVTSAPGADLRVEGHEIAYAESDSAAQKIFDAEKTAVKVNGTAVLIAPASNDHGKVNLTVTVPPGAHVLVNAQHGDVAADGVGAGISVTSPHGDVKLNSISGGAQVHVSSGDFSAHNMQGDVTAQGSCGDLNFSDVKGALTLYCEYFNDMHMERIAGPVHFKTSRSDIQIGSLPGDLSLNDNSMNVTDATGAVRVVTHSRDIDLSQIYGDIYVEDTNNTVSLEPAGAYNIEVHNTKGDIAVTLPPNASATVDGRAHNGDIVSDYPLTIGGGTDKTISGRVGSGTTRIVLNSSNGDIRIKKGSAFPAAPPVPAAPPAAPGAPSKVQAAPAAPAAPNARHLKVGKEPPSAPVAQ
jgi:DUF4097 and DUF4098 domain-containing protein YvlB